MVIAVSVECSDAVPQTSAGSQAKAADPLYVMRDALPGFSSGSPLTP